MPASSDALRRAQELLNLKRYDDAAALAAQVLGATPDDVDAMVTLGRALVARGEAGDALPVLERAAAARPDSPDVLLALCAAELAARPRRARVTAARLVQVAPDLWRAHTAQARAWMMFPPRLCNAERAARRAVALAPEEPAAHTVLGITLFSRPRAARACFEKALAVDPQHVEARLNLAELAATRWRLGTAVGHALGAAATSPADARAARSARAAVWRLLGALLLIGVVVLVSLGRLASVGADFIWRPLVLVTGFGVAALALLLVRRSLRPSAWQLISDALRSAGLAGWLARVALAYVGVAAVIVGVLPPRPAVEVVRVGGPLTSVVGFVLAMVFLVWAVVTSRRR